MPPPTLSFDMVTADPSSQGQLEFIYLEHVWIFVLGLAGDAFSLPADAEKRRFYDVLLDYLAYT